MRRIYIFASAIIVALLFIAASGGVTTVQNLDRTGSPVSTTGCNTCHSGGSFSPTLTLTLKDLSNNVVTQYTPGASYKLEVSFGGNVAPRYGYQAVALLNNNANAGSLTTANTFSKTNTLNSRTYGEHNGLTSSTLYTLNWTAPAAGSGQVKFYSRGIASNATGSTNGDSPVSATALTINESITNHPSSNGTAVISSFNNCSTNSAGTLQIGSAVSGVSQTISVNVGTAGTYNLSAVSSGVTFSGSGTFAATGVQNVVLTASGTPNSLGSKTFTLNTTPNCSFTRTVNNVANDPSSNGTAQITSFGNCNVSSAGNLVIGSAASGVTQTISVNVGFAGTYNLSAVSSGVTFSGSGTFATTGVQNVVLTASGTPNSLGSKTFTLNTTPNCSFTRTVNNVANDPSSNGTAQITSFANCNVSSAGNLVLSSAVSGVTQTISVNVGFAGTYNLSAAVNGVTFSGSGTFAATGVQNVVLTASGTPTSLGSNTFTLNTTPNCSFTRNVSNIPNDASSNGTAVIASFTDCATDTLGVLTIGTNVVGVSQTISVNVTSVGSYSISAQANGITFSASGNFSTTGSQNIVLTGSGTPNTLGLNTFTLNTSPNCSFERFVAPQPNDPSSNGSAVISSFINCDVSSLGSLTLAEVVSGVSQTIEVDVASLGSYSLSAVANGINFEASGSFTSLGIQEVVLTASGTPTLVGSNNFSINTTPNCSFNREVADQGNGILSLSSEALYFYPNPSSDVIYFDQNIRNAEVTVYDINGKISLRAEIVQSQEINISSLPKGLYFLQVVTGDGAQFYNKLIKE